MSEKIEIHWLTKFNDEHFQRLRALLDARLQLTMGETIPEGARPHVLITGFPPREHLEENGRLQAMVIPFAGVPSPTSKILADFPDLAVHNIHHNAVPVAEMTVALYLAVARKLLWGDQTMRNGRWLPGYYASDKATSISAYRKKALILGYGAIGREVAVRCQAFGMQVMATRRSVETPEKDDLGVAVYPSFALSDLLPQTDALLITLPLTPETEGLIGEAELALLPPQAVIVNVGRGPVIDQKALYEALKDGRLYGAALDVWYHYPTRGKGDPLPPADYPFHELDNVVLSPHRAGNTFYTELARVEHLAEVLNPLAEGQPMPNRIQMGRGY